MWSVRIILTLLEMFTLAQSRPHQVIKKAPAEMDYQEPLSSTCVATSERQIKDIGIVSLQVLTKKKLQDLVREIDPNEQLDEDVEEVSLHLCTI